MFRKNLSPVLVLILLFATSLLAQTAKRPMKLDDLARFRNVNDPQISPDGQWVAYVVATIDAKEDKSNTKILTTHSLPLSAGAGHEGTQRWCIVAPKNSGVLKEF